MKAIIISYFNKMNHFWYVSMHLKDDFWKLHRSALLAYLCFHHMAWHITQNSLLRLTLYEQIHKIVQYLSALYTLYKRLYLFDWNSSIKLLHRWQHLHDLYVESELYTYLKRGSNIAGNNVLQVYVTQLWFSMLLHHKRWEHHLY